VTGSGGATYVQFSQIFIALLNGVICLFVAMPGLGQGHKGQRGKGLPVGRQACLPAGRHKEEIMSLKNSVPLCL